MEYISKTSFILPTPLGVDLFEVFETKKFLSGILGHRKSSERFSAAGKKISSSLWRPLLKSRGLLFSCIRKTFLFVCWDTKLKAVYTAI